MDYMGYGLVYDGYFNAIGSKYPVPLLSQTDARTYCPRGSTCKGGV
jgi:hypothetical protein